MNLWPLGIFLVFIAFWVWIIWRVKKEGPGEKEK